MMSQPSQSTPSEDALLHTLQKEFGLLGKSLLSEVRQELRIGLQNIKFAVKSVPVGSEVPSDYALVCVGDVAHSLELGSGSALMMASKAPTASQRSNGSMSRKSSAGTASDEGGYVKVSASIDDCKYDE